MQILRKNESIKRMVPGGLWLYCVSPSVLTAACVMPSLLPATRGRCPWPRCWQNSRSKTWLSVVMNSRKANHSQVWDSLKTLTHTSIPTSWKIQMLWKMFQDRYGLETILSWGTNKLRLPNQKFPYNTLPPWHCVVQLWAGVCYKAAPSKVNVRVL